MTEQNNRCARVTIFKTNPINPKGTNYKVAAFDKNAPNALEITEDFCIEFEVEKTSESKPNTAKLTISNLNDSTRAFIAQKPATVKLEAGYDGEYRHLFIGDMVNSYSQTKGATLETIIMAGDGSRSLRWSRVNQSYKPGTPTLVALRFAAQTMGIVLPDNVLADAELQRPLPSSESLYGSSRDELARLLAPYGYTFHIQNGQPIIIKDEQVVDNQAIVLDNDAWLIGSGPEYQTPEKASKPTKLKIPSMLYPEIVPGKKLRVVSKSIDGVFKCIKVKHTGKTEDGGDWKSDVEAVVLADKVTA